MLNALVGSTGKELILDWPGALRVRTLVVLNENTFNSHSTCILFKTGELSLDTRALRDEFDHFHQTKLTTSPSPLLRPKP
jgi:hypothetical protein